METFKEVFDNYILKQTNKDITIISDLCIKFDINPNDFLKNYIKTNSGTGTGTDFFTELLETFIFYLEKQIDKELLKYVKYHGINIYKEPYLSINYELKYSTKKGFKIKDKKNLEKFIINNLTVSQKQELLKNKLFSHIILQTNLKIYSNKDIRFLKLKNLHECN